MIRINLLPHRAAKRALKKREFNFIILGAVVGAATLWFVGKNILDNEITNQQRRNDILAADNKKLSEQIEEIKRLKDQTSALIARKQVVETLQVNRGASVKLLDQLVRQLPDGVYLKSVKQSGQAVNIIGLAQSNARVSTLMRNLDASPYLQNAQLVEIKNVNDKNQQRINEFSLNVSLKGLEAAPSVKRSVAGAPGAMPAPDARTMVMQAITK